MKNLFENLKIGTLKRKKYPLIKWGLGIVSMLLKMAQNNTL